MEQQYLALNLKPHNNFAHYYPGKANRLVVNTLTKLTPGDCIYVWGNSGVGVSHILQACCEAAETVKQQAIYIDLQLHAQMRIELLEGLESYTLVALDHFDAIVGLPEWEHALFHLYNRSITCQNTILIGARVAPMALLLNLADLRSRLTSMLVLHLKPLDDADKLIALQQQASQLGLDLPSDVGQYLLNRAERDLASLLTLLNRLDQASLRAQRKLTIPFIKRILAT